nr:hypothetical protein [Flavobacterium sp. ASV13]
MIITATLLSACSITKKYERPSTLSTDKLYRCLLYTSDAADDDGYV